MKKITTLISSALLIACAASAFANCPRCVEARENNKINGSNEFFYYEDYVNAEQKKANDEQKN